MEFAIFVLIILVVDLAAILWGVDSNDGINSSEWERRQAFFRA